MLYPQWGGRKGDVLLQMLVFIEGISYVCVCLGTISRGFNAACQQAHLYDCFSQTTSHLSCLRATIPAHGCKYDESHISISQCDATCPHVHYAFGAAHRINDRRQQVCIQYRVN